MIDLFGYDISLISLPTAFFGAFLSLYNYYIMSKPANIVPNQIISYGLINSGYQESYKFCIPLIFHNNGAKKGLITDVKIGFKTNGDTKYLDITGKAKLIELVDEQLASTDWDGFTKHGYRLLQPTYPIPILGNESIDVVLIGTSAHEDNDVPINTECKCVIEITFGKNKTNQIEFPFYLDENVIPDDRIIWLSPIAKED
ncbi:MAG: hypothetical protein ACXAC7_14565 [Candidatus Hodarchaeales archaeon]|jgi:hypothetical protein